MAAKRLRPVHPGDILLHDFMRPLKLSSYKVAEELGVAAQTVNEIVRRRRAITAGKGNRVAREGGKRGQLSQDLPAAYDFGGSRTQIRKKAEIAILSSTKADVSGKG